MYHFGIGEVVSISTFSRANENRSYCIYEDLAMLLIEEAKRVYVDDTNLEVQLKNNVFGIDATTIDLCFSAFHWATFRSTKAGIQLHTQIDLKTAIQEFIWFSNASVHDVHVLDSINFESTAFM